MTKKFLRYLSHNKAYKVFNKRTTCVEKSIHAIFDESNQLIDKGSQEVPSPDGPHLESKQIVINSEGEPDPQKNDEEIHVIEEIEVDLYKNMHDIDDNSKEDQVPHAKENQSHIQSILAKDQTINEQIAVLNDEIAKLKISLTSSQEEIIKLKE
ncbi:hypothetical protein HAX54_016349 [Datura stramonium]|uniref:Uncharacterized protein n=1 Tax=Datura stramonium TaxID=4076 RepID=A0ABS8UIW4_DATST|nr:hypothetical protein [Datura stramonium]